MPFEHHSDCAGTCGQECGGTFVVPDTSASMALRAYETVLDATESFEKDNIGAALAYLMGAILKGERVDVFLPEDDDKHVGPLFRLLRQHLHQTDDPILAFFQVHS